MCREGGGTTEADPERGGGGWSGPFLESELSKNRTEITI